MDGACFGYETVTTMSLNLVVSEVISWGVGVTVSGNSVVTVGVGMGEGGGSADGDTVLVGTAVNAGAGVLVGDIVAVTSEAPDTTGRSTAAQKFVAKITDDNKRKYRNMARLL